MNEFDEMVNDFDAMVAELDVALETGECDLVDLLTRATPLVREAIGIAEHLGKNRHASLGKDVLVRTLAKLRELGAPHPEETPC